MATIGRVRDVAKEFEWRIEDFFSLLEKKEERHTSPLFAFAGESWNLKIYTNSDEEEETIDVYLFRCMPGPPIRLRWSVGLKTAKGENDQERHFTNVFEKETEGYGSSMFLKKSMLSELVPSDVLTIVCKLETSPSSTEEPRGLQKLRDQPNEKLDSDDNSGVAINAKDGESQPHRNILANRNPFFNSVYKTKMKDIVETEEITTNVKEGEFQQHRDIPYDDNPFYISMFSPQIEDILESEELCNETTNVEDNELTLHKNIKAHPNPFFNYMSNPTNEGTLESEELSGQTTIVEDEFRLHKNNPGDLNPFFNSIFNPRMERTLESEELSDQTIKMEDELKLHRNNQADPNPFFDSIFSPKAAWTLESEELSNEATKVEDDEFRLHRNNQAHPNSVFNSMFSPRNKVALESKELSDQTTKVEDNEFRLHRNNQNDPNSFFNRMFKTEMTERVRRRKRSKANDQEFSNTDSIITTEAKDGEFQQYRNIPVGHNLSFNTIFEVLNNVLETEERIKRRLIEISIDKSEDSISSEDSTSSKDSILSKDSASSKASSAIFLTSDSEVSNVATSNEEFRLLACPTCHNVYTLYRMAKYRQDYQLHAECLRFMKNMLSVDTFYDVIVLALNHDEKELLQDATEFFCRNTKEIIHRVKWQTFMREYPTQANQLYIKAFHYYAK